MKKIYKTFIPSWILTLLILISLVSTIESQQSIAWQQSIGTPSSDNAIKIFTDDEGNMVIMGDEVHPDFTGNLRNYLVISKIDLSGHPLWKTYHDVPYETFNPPLDYYFGDHFYTVENGQKYVSIVLSIGSRRLLYKIADDTGEFYSTLETGTNVFTMDRNNVQVFANVTCSQKLECYGPDSLIVQKINPEPVIGFNPIVWTFELKQNIRTAPIQGHYDFNNQDITTDEEGNVYLLTQIERWDFQFCTDCGDAFIDAWSEVFKFDTSGQLVKRVKLKTANAVVTNMRFVQSKDETLLVKIDDINNAGTAVISSLYFLNRDLSLTKQFSLDRQYDILTVDSAFNIFTCNAIFDQADPNIKGMTDVLVSKFNSDGGFQWKSYFGGTDYEFPKGMVLTKDGGLVFFANTFSDDFDVAENNGSQDMWLVKLTENGTTGIKDQSLSPELMIYPNPTIDFIHVNNVVGNLYITIYDVQGREIGRQTLDPVNTSIDLESLQGGLYLVRAVNDVDQVFSAKILKL